jgi:hypothetical protein
MAESFWGVLVVLILPSQEWVNENREIGYWTAAPLDTLFSAMSLSHF